MPHQPIRRRPVLAATLAVAAGAVLAACAGPPPPTVVNLALAAAANVNPSREGRPSPIVVQIYQLKTQAKFDEADFFQLTGNAEAALGPTLAGKEQVVLAPGQTTTLVRTLDPETRVLGLTASYRDIDNAAWRAVVPVEAHKTTSLNAALGERAVQLTRVQP